MTIPTASLTELKRRARAGDAEALQELRDCGFFRNKRAAHEGYAVSYSQRRLWVVDQMVDGFGAYNLPTAMYLTGELQVAVLREAMQAVVRRHESLRTTFAQIRGEIRQFVHDQIDFQLREIDLADDPESEQRASEIAARHAADKFDLLKGPLFRAALLRLAPCRHLFLFNIHHVISDVVSLGNLVRDVSVFYEALSRSSEPALPPLRIQYKDFAAWQNKLLSGEEGQRHREYWLRQLCGQLAVLNLPVDFPRPPLKTYVAGVWHRVMDAALTARLNQLGRKHEATLFMVLTALVKVLLQRYTGQEEIVTSCPVAGRQHPDLADQVGFYVNPVILRDRLSPNESFTTVLGRIRQTILEAYEHQVYPFDHLLEELDVSRDTSRAPLADVSINFMNKGQRELRLGQVQVTPYDDKFYSSKVDLAFDVSESSTGLELAITYCLALFREGKIARLAEHLVHLAESVLADPQRSIGQLELLSAAEGQQLLVEFNDNAAPFSADKTIIDLFEELAANVPDATAVRFGDRQFSYRELNQRANEFAHHLQQAGVGPEALVGVFLERSVDLVVAFVGILKAGGVYVPLDPVNPIERLEGMLQDSQVIVIVTQTSLVDRLPITPGRYVFCVDEEVEQISSQPDDNLPRQAAPDSAAYVIYTSGSTGKPKGTVLLHRGLLNIRQEQGRLFQPLVGDRVLQFAAIGFDASIFEMVMALGSGSTLCLGTRDQLLPGTALLRFLADEEISIVTLPPSALAVMKEAELPNLRVITVAGEVCPVDVVTRWAKGRCFFNLYGPTETTIWATHVRCEPDGQVPTIGKPIANTRVYLVDRQLQPVPLGVPGELCIAGVGLAREYLQRPELTAEQFVPNPFSDGRLYRTGDLARYLVDGTIQFLGRVDHQVKVRGYRIELGEIEAVLHRHAQIREAVVLAREDEADTKRLVAYVVPSNPSAPLEPATLKDDLRRKLPEYMVPAVFVVMDEIPLTPNNKVDRQRLPPPDGSRTDGQTQYVAPRDDLEHVLVQCIQEVLQVERVGVYDNFFDLGGDSLLATQIVSRVHESFHVELSIPQIFLAVDVASIAGLVRGAIPEGQADKIARTIRRLAEMSEEEKRVLLERKRQAALGGNGRNA